jgi:hypothetical protein
MPTKTSDIEKFLTKGGPLAGEGFEPSADVKQKHMSILALQF